MHSQCSDTIHALEDKIEDLYLENMDTRDLAIATADILASHNARNKQLEQQLADSHTKLLAAETKIAHLTKEVGRLTSDVVRVNLNYNHLLDMYTITSTTLVNTKDIINKLRTGVERGETIIQTLSQQLEQFKTENTSLQSRLTDTLYSHTNNNALIQFLSTNLNEAIRLKLFYLERLAHIANSNGIFSKKYAAQALEDAKQLQSPAPS
jgi:chromosome segregation ATPase